MRSRGATKGFGRPRIAPAVVLAGAACLIAAAAAPAATPLSDPLAPTRSGRTLTSANGGWLCIGGCAYSYAWQRCKPACATVPGATGPTYLLRTPDIGASIRSLVTAGDMTGSATRASAQTGPIAAAPPANVIPPSMSGTARVGSLLTSAPGSWDDPHPASVAYARAWVRCPTITAKSSCVPVSSASNYVPGSPDVGHFIRRRETAEGLGAATAFSSPLGAIQQVPPAQGTPFTSGGRPTTPPTNPTTLKRRLRPFPVVVVAGRLRRGRTVIRDFTVRGPRRARVRLRCRGRACPFRRISRTIGSRRRVRIRRAQRTYRPGTVIEVRITGRNRIGKFTRLRFRRGAPPARRDLCLQPGARRPTRCS